MILCFKLVLPLLLYSEECMERSFCSNNNHMEQSMILLLDTLNKHI